MVLGYCPVCGHEIRQKDFFNGVDYECPNCGSLIKFTLSEGGTGSRHT